MSMTLPSFFILVILGFIGLWIILWLGGHPGKKAAERNHPQAEAINILGWIGLLTGGPGWIVAVVWAYARPVLAPVEAAPAAGKAPTPEAPAEEAS